MLSCIILFSMSFCTILCSIYALEDSYGSDASAASVSFLAPAPLQMKAVRELFPYEGRFLFRIYLKESDITQRESNNPSSYVWLDMVGDDDKTLPYFKAGDVVRLRALCLDDHINNQDVDNFDYDEYLSDVYATLPRNRPDRQPIEVHNTSSSTSSNALMKKLKAGVKSGIKTLSKEAHEVSAASNITLKSVSQGATSVWNTLKASLGVQLQTSSSSLSDAAEENLSQLSEDLASIFTDSNTEHVAALKELWSGLFSNNASSSSSSFTRTSAKWKEAGFQNPDPVSDLKTSGILAIRAMAYMARTHPLRTQDMMQRNKENTKAKYPFAIVGVNVTLLLAEVLNLRDQRYLAMQATYWEIFEAQAAFFELFCCVFHHIDITWASTNATRSDFAKIIGQAKQLVSSALNKSPKSLGQFRSIAVEVGMHLDSM